MVTSTTNKCFYTYVKKVKEKQCYSNTKIIPPIKTYEECLETAKRMNKDEKFAQSLYKMNLSKQKFMNKKNNQKIEVIDYLKLNNTTKDNKPNQKENNVLCQALTLSKTKCKFKAVCGNYCKKHSKK